MPEDIHWRVYLELADVAKRDNHLGQARKLFEKALEVSPTVPQVWIEYSKMEEECGELDNCKVNKKEKKKKSKHISQCLLFFLVFLAIAK
jgi:hypothetical protein